MKAMFDTHRPKPSQADSVFTIETQIHRLVDFLHGVLFNIPSLTGASLFGDAKTSTRYA